MSDSNVKMEAQAAKMASALGAAGVVWWEMNVQTGAVEYDPRKSAGLGYPSDYFKTYRDFVALVHPDDESAIMEAMQDHLSGKTEHYEMDYRMKISDGTYRWFHDIGSVVRRDSQGAPLVVRGLVMDVSQSKATATELREMNHFFEGIANSLPGMLAYWDKNLVCTFANSQYLLWFGRTREQMLGITMRELLGETLFEKNRPYIEGALEGRIQRFERTLVRTDGTVGYTLAQYLPDVKDGQVLGFVALVSDVTELKEAQLRAEDATRAKSEFLANMSHEIRTPMNAITGLAYLALQTELSEHQRDYIDKIKQSAENLLGIINDILDFSKIEAGKMRLEIHTFSLFELVGHVCDLVSAKAEEKGLELVVDIAEGVAPDLRGDALRLGQILGNLLSNAVKFTFRGHVVLSVHPVAPSGPSRTNALRFTVADTGIGMSPEQVSRVAEPFTQADSSTTRRFGGTGLGLSIVKNLVELMGGSLVIESVEGEGSQLSFELSLEAGDSIVEPDVEDLEGLRVLVVEDSVLTQKVLDNMLRRYRCLPTLVDSGAAALSLLSRPVETPFDVILMDWAMPGLNGIDTTRILRKLLPQTQIVVMVTAFERTVLKDLGADEQLLNGLLQKPVQAATLIQELRRVVGSYGSPQPVFYQQVNVQKRDPSRLMGIRVLLAEDNAINQQIAREILSQAGVIVDTVANGREAVDRLASGSEYDLVLMDVQMPILDGLEATREIRSLLGIRPLPIIAMTAYALPAEKERCLEAGMDDHVAKPFSSAQLFETLDHWVKPRVQEITPVQNPVEPLPGDGFPPLLPGINVTEGLERIVDAQLFSSLLKEFGAGLTQDLAEVKACLGAEDLVRSRTLLHRMRGTASNLSAVTVAGAAHRLEQALVDRDPGREALVSGLDKAVVEYLESVASLP